MIKTFKYFTLFFIGCTSLTAIKAQDQPSMKTLKSMLTANMYFMQKWPDPGKPIVTEGENPSNTWTRGVYYEGLMELYKINPNEAFLDYTLSWAQFHKWNMPDGVKTRNADNQCCGQTYIDLYLLDRYKEERIKNIRSCIDSMIVRNKIDDWKSTDALQMAMPVFARLGKIYNDDKYFDRMHEMYLFTKLKHGDKGLYNSEEHLWHDKDFDATCAGANGANCYWSRGNGWVVAALVRTLEFLPNNNKYRREYETTLKEMFEALVPLQRADGYWNASLKDKDQSGGKELTGTALFVYGMAWGINEGLISKKDYLPVVSKAWSALLTESLNDNGSLGDIQGNLKMPKGQTKGDTAADSEDFGLGCFLLAGSEMYRLQKDMEPKEKMKKEKPEKEKAGKGKNTGTKKDKKTNS